LFTRLTAVRAVLEAAGLVMPPVDETIMDTATSLEAVGALN
jgi:hypothetical protein